MKQLSEFDAFIRQMHSAGLIVEDLSGDADILLRVTTPTGATQLYEVQIKPKVSPSNAALQPAARAKTLVVASYIPESVADSWRAQDVHYLDSAGNMYLRLEGILLDVRGRRASTTPRPIQPGKPLRMFRSSGLKVLFVLLVEPSMAAAPYREIAYASESSVGTVQWVFKELEELGYVSPGLRRRVLHRTGNLFNRWVEAYVLNLSPGLTIARYDAPDPTWWTYAETDLRAETAQWGGETAAHFLTKRLRPSRAVIYAFKVPTQLAVKYRFRKAQDEGNVEVRERFWPDDNSSNPTVPTPLVYADLIASDDPRQREVAQYLREHDDHLRRLDRG